MSQVGQCQPRPPLPEQKFAGRLAPLQVRDFCPAVPVATPRFRTCHAREGANLLARLMRGRHVAHDPAAPKDDGLTYSGERKLIFVNRFFYPNESATSQILSDLSFHLAARGWPVHVVTGRPEKSFSLSSSAETLHAVQVHRIWSSNLGSASLFKRLIDYATFYPSAIFKIWQISGPGDVVVVKTDPPLISIAAYPAARIRGAKFVNWLQDIYPEVAMHLGVRLLQGPVGRLLAVARNWVLKRSNANVVIGNRMERRLLEAGVPQNKIQVIPNWTDDDTVLPQPALASPIRREWGIAEETFLFGYSGNLGRAHDSATLVGAAKLLKEREDICFLFVGGGHELRKLQGDAAEACENFIFRNYQPRERLSASLAAADAHWVSLRPELEGLIVPSKFYGIAAAGRPVVVIGSGEGEVARLVSEAGCGFVVEPGDCVGLANVIEILADDPSLRSDLGKRARAALEKHHSRTLAFERWTTLLTEVMGQHSNVERG